MRNETVVENFFNGKDSHTANVYGAGNRLYNYSTTLARRVDDNTMIINLTRYSNSTTRIQYYIKCAMTAHPRINYIVRNDEPFGTRL